MATKYYLGVVDYSVMFLTLLISMAIGIGMRFTGGKQKTTSEYLMAGKNMSMIPVILSICVTAVSAVGMLGTASEVYKFGTQLFIGPLAVSIGLTLAAYVMIPVYFQCNVTSIYELLEKRFGKATRRTVSALFLIQVVLYQAVVLYVPVLALVAVTDLSFELSIVVFGVVCTIYSSVGGLKGVLWTDVFQAVIMLCFFLVIFVSAVLEIGGFTNLYTRVQRGGRWDFFNFDASFTTRYTFWSCFFYGLFYGYNYYGANQVEVQRLLSMSSAERAKKTLLNSIGLVVATLLSFYALGLAMFAVFYKCDPISDEGNTGLQKYDQLIPYYVVSRFSAYPGVTGFCIAGVFSGSLSTVSSMLNSLSTVTVVDFVQPFFSSKLTDSHTVLLAKTLSFLYGFLCIGLSFVVSKFNSIFEVANIFIACIEGPVGAVFTAGVLSRKVSGKFALTGLFAGLFLSCWIGYGSLFSGYSEPHLPLSTTGCSTLSQNSTLLTSTTEDNCSNCSSEFVKNPSRYSETFLVYKISYMWLRAISMVTSILVMFMGALLTGWKDVIPADSMCLNSFVQKITEDPEKDSKIHHLSENNIQMRTRL